MRTIIKIKGHRIGQITTYFHTLVATSRNHGFIPSHRPVQRDNFIYHWWTIYSSVNFKLLWCKSPKENFARSCCLSRQTETSKITTRNRVWIFSYWRNTSQFKLVLYIRHFFLPRRQFKLLQQLKLIYAKMSNLYTFKIKLRDADLSSWQRYLSVCMYVCTRARLWLLVCACVHVCVNLNVHLCVCVSLKVC